MKKVFVGLSGGVDSSVSAALLQKAGYQVTGVFIRVWQPDFFRCGWKDDRLDAMRVCATLGIPFRELNLEKEYKREVVDYMIREYRAGRTPNPDVACNRFVKFGKFYQWARAQGADFIATGHYARIVPTLQGKVEDPRFVKQIGKKNKLLSGVDTNKDQSYFLWRIQKEQLPHLLFPVGAMKKPAVRKLAKKFNLITAEKKDSQGLCFVGKVDMKEFLSHYIKSRKGKVVRAPSEVEGDESGKIIGEHDGAFFYTIGERVAGQYVVGKDMQKNVVFVACKNLDGAFARVRREIEITDCNWVGELPQTSTQLSARLRYRAPLTPCYCNFTGHSVSGKRARVVFESPQLAAPGQSLVLYRGEELIGGGVII